MQYQTIGVDSSTQPAYYHRQYENDLGNGENTESFAKRATLVALPFLALYQPAGRVLSISMDALRGVTSLSGTVEALSDGQLLRIGQSVLQVSLSLTALFATIFMHPIGMFVTTGHDIMINGFAVGKSLYEGDYQVTLESSGQILNSGIYLAMIATNSIGLVVLSLLIQTGVEGYKSLKEYKNERYLEVFAHLLMTCIRTSQLSSQCHIMQLSRQQEASDVGAFNEQDSEFADAVKKAIKEKDLATFSQLKEQSEWDELTQSDLEGLTEALGDSFKDSDQAFEGIKTAMLEAMICEGPKNPSVDVKELKSSLRNACSKGDVERFKDLMATHPAKDELKDVDLLKLVKKTNWSAFISPGDDEAMQKINKGKILKLLIKDPRWNRNSPEILEKALRYLISGFAPGSDLMEVLSIFKTYPSWERLESSAIARVLAQGNFHFIGTDEHEDRWNECAKAGKPLPINESSVFCEFMFKTFSGHPSWEKMSAYDLARVTRNVCSLSVNRGHDHDLSLKMSVLDLLANHPQWEHMEPSHLMEIGMNIFYSGKGEVKCFELLSRHPKWDEMSATEFNILIGWFYEEIQAKEIYAIFSKHPQWKKAKLK